MLKKFGFGRDTPATAPAPSPPDPVVDTLKLLARHREMVRIAVKGTLNEHGLGATWVGSDVSFSATPPLAIDPTLSDVLNIRLIVQEWREELLRYLPALQLRIVQSLARVQPAIDHSKHTVTWQFAPDCGCPVNDLPPSASWAAKAAVRAGPGTRVQERAPQKATSITPKFDLPPSELDYARRDHDDPIPSTFAASQPGFLNSQPEFQNTQPYAHPSLGTSASTPTPAGQPDSTKKPSAH